MEKTPGVISASLITFGCRVNQADSLALEADLRARGIAISAPDEADLVIVNTCSVTASADQGTRQIVRRIARNNPAARIVVTGCYATRRPDEVAALPNVVRVVSNGEKDDLIAQLAAEGGPTTADRYAGGNDSCGAALMPGLGGRTALTLRVQTGCEERCSYCIIPQTRGASRSRPAPDVLRQIRMAVDAGYKEVVLTGVHLGSYGRDLGDGSSLTSLAGTLATWRDDVLFRISSLEPMDCPSDLVDLVAASPRLAPHFHLPLQHGSDDMLGAMRRPYSAAYYEDLVCRIRVLMPHASIGSDIIVGFPGETDAHFEQMCRVLARLPLTHLHVFPYSDRPGTSASTLPSRVDGATIRARGQEVRRIGAEMARRFRATQCGARVRALTVDDGWSAVTTNYLKVKIDRQCARNEWVDVQLNRAGGAVVVEKTPGVAKRHRVLFPNS